MPKATRERLLGVRTLRHGPWIVTRLFGSLTYKGKALVGIRPNARIRSASATLGPPKSVPFVSARPERHARSNFA